MRPGRMTEPAQPPRLPAGTESRPHGRLLPRLVAAAFLIAVAALGLASWDIARGRAPETASPLVQDLLETPENRRCSRDAGEALRRHLPAGMARAEALRLLAGAVVTPPRPWFWTPVVEDRLFEETGRIRFTRVIRYTAFGNQKLTGEITLAEGLVQSASGEVVCALG